MVELKQKYLYTYDIEIFPNLFTVTYYNHYLDTYGEYIVWENEETEKSLLNEEKEETFKNIDKFFSNICDRYGNVEEYKTFISYNGLKYDDIMIGYLKYYIKTFGAENLSCKKLKEFSNYLINDVNQPFIDCPDATNHWVCKSIDLCEIYRKGRKSAGSLKAIGIKIKHNTTQESSHPFNEVVKNYSTISKIKEYNKNDVIITKKIFLHSLGDIELRNNIANEYNFSHLLTASNSRIAKILYRKWYYQRTKTNKQQLEASKKKYIKECLPNKFYPSEVIFLDRVKFQTEEFQRAYENFLQIPIVYYPEKKKYEFERTYNEKIDAFKKRHINFELNCKKYTIGLGGLHSIDEPAMFICGENEEIIDIDVSSQYPNMIINNKIAPAHLDKEQFIQMYSVLVDERLKAKAKVADLERKNENDTKEYKDNKKKTDTYKIVINSGYGFFNDLYYFFYDPYASYKTTINCQLFLLMLIEKLDMTDGINILSTNTDGIIIRVQNYAKEKYKKIKSEWEQEQNFTLEESHYKKYVRNHVNDYLAEIYKGNGKTKLKNKGTFFASNELELGKGYNYPIIGTCLQNYFSQNKPIIETLHEAEDIYDFCYFEKINKRQSEEDSGWDKVFIDYVELYTLTHKKGNNAKYIILSSNETQFINRYYIYKGDEYYEKEGYISRKGYSLKKGKQLENGSWEFNKFGKKYCIMPFNDYFDVEVSDDPNIPLKNYNIDYNFYEIKCNELINEIEKNINPDKDDKIH